MQATTAILITNYNNAPWIRACVDSALNQTMAADEVVVFDDGSDDGSLEILRGYGERIRLIEGRRSEGPPRKIERQALALEAALRVSTAQRVHILDGDDYYLADRIETYGQAWDASPSAQLIQAPIQFICPQGKVTGIWTNPALAGVQDLARLIRETADPMKFFVSSAFAFRRDLMESAMPVDFSDGLTVAVDTRLAFEAALRGDVVTLGTAHTAYRVRSGSIADETGMRGGARCKETLRNLKCFNLTARRLGRPQARAWTSPKWLRQRCRACLPVKLGDWLAGWLFERRQKTRAETRPTPL